MTIDERMVAVKAQFAELNEQIGLLMEKRGELDRQISALKETQVELRGQFKLLDGMKAEDGSKETVQ